MLSALNGQDALHVVREHKGAPVRLVITDVIMPLMGGKVMAEWLESHLSRSQNPFTSGYTDEAIADQGVLETGVELYPNLTRPRSGPQSAPVT